MRHCAKASQQPHAAAARYDPYLSVEAGQMQVDHVAGGVEMPLIWAERGRWIPVGLAGLSSRWIRPGI